MRFLIILAALVLIAVVVVLVTYGLADRPAAGKTQLERGARWEPHTESSDGVTTVVVRHVSRDDAGDLVAEIGRQTIAAIPDDDPLWEDRYHEAMARARSRVAALESQAD